MVTAHLGRAGDGDLPSLAVRAGAAEWEPTEVEPAIAQLVRALTQEVRALNEKVTEVDRLIEAGFRAHELAEIVASMPGIGPLLGAELLAAIGPDLESFAGPDGLAAFAGLAPAPNDSGKRNGNLHRPRHYHRGLQRIFYMSALTSIRYDPNSRTFYDRKHAKGNATPRPSTLSPAAESTCCGP